MAFRSLALASLTVLASAGGAWAHAHLKSSSPAAGAAVAAPAEIDLAFTEAVNPKFTGASVAGPGDTAVPAGPARSGPGGDATLVVPLAGRLAPGAYRVDWHALAVDGHKTKGSFAFTVAP